MMNYKTELIIKILPEKMKEAGIENVQIENGVGLDGMMMKVGDQIFAEIYGPGMIIYEPHSQYISFDDFNSNVVDSIIQKTKEFKKFREENY